jgi:small-conductance mechanosensitive channel
MASMAVPLAQDIVLRFSKEWWLSVGIALGAIIVVAAVVNAVARRYVRRLIDRAEQQQRDDPDRDRAQRLRRTATVARLILSTFQVVVWTIVVLVVVGSIGVNLGPLIAGAGILGVALGFGAQSIVRDTLAGFFILAEDQFAVGDVVELQTTGGAVSGTIEALTLRVTSIRAFDGTLNIVPNGNINVTSNKTRGWGRAIVDVRLTFDQDVEHVRTVLHDLFRDLAGVEPYATGLREEPKVLGIVQLTVDAQVLRVTAETIPSRRWEIERELRERITMRLAESGVAPPASPMIVPHPPKPRVAGSPLA